MASETAVKPTPTIDAIRAGRDQHAFTFFGLADLYRVIEENPLQPVLVRCGCCRFVAPAQNVRHIQKALEAAGDYVRDYSFPIGG